ncbi:MAG: hypothetical protein SNH79_01145 [Rikenellaceae bacterium]
MKIENRMYAACEIAELLGVTLPSVRGAIKRLMKTRTIVDCAGGEVIGNRIAPTHYGLEVVIAIAFQFNTHEAKQFQQHILSKVNSTPNVFVRLPHDNVVFS